VPANACTRAMLRWDPDAIMAVVWDYAAALQRMGGDEPLLSELIAVFFEEYPKFAGRLTQSLAQQDFAALREAAHSLKGSLGYLGASEAEALALELEQASLEADRAVADSLVARLMANIESLRQVMLSPTDEQDHGSGLQ